MPTIESVLFDMDGVLSRSDLSRRLQVLAAGTGLTAEAIDERLYASGFDARADEGLYSAEEYMAECARLLGVPVPLELWLDARRAGMSFDHEMLALARSVGERAETALLTNNGPVLREHLDRVAPEIVALFGERAFFSCQFGTSKTRAAVFGRVLTTLGWEPDTTLFIDDTAEYLANAHSAGLHTHQFHGITALRSELRRLGLL